MPVCCRIELCCDPPAAATDLAEWLNAQERTAHLDRATLFLIADTLLGEHRLVPKTLEPVGAAKETAMALTAQKELAQIHRLLRARLPRILEDLGYGKVTLQEAEPD